jgi:hypothetical protein
MQATGPTSSITAENAARLLAHSRGATGAGSGYFAWDYGRESGTDLRCRARVGFNSGSRTEAHDEPLLTNEARCELRTRLLWLIPASN